MIGLAALPALVGPVLKQFLPATVIGWINLALGIIVQGKNVKDRLDWLNEEIQGFADRGEEPPVEWWTQRRMESDVAHGDIQDAADEVRNMPASTGEGST